MAGLHQAEAFQRAAGFRRPRADESCGPAQVHPRSNFDFSKSFPCRESEDSQFSEASAGELEGLLATR